MMASQNYTDFSIFAFFKTQCNPQKITAKFHQIFMLAVLVIIINWVLYISSKDNFLFLALLYPISM